MRRLLNCLIVLAIFSLSGALRAEAGEDHLKTGFFEQGSVRNVFGDQMKSVGQSEMEYFAPLPQKVSEAPDTPAKLSAQSPKDATPQVVVAATEDPVEAELLAKYGDPDKDAPIQGVESAPTPFKGLMAALEAKRDDIAFRYARQYVRHLENLRARTNRVMGLTNLAMEKEGMTAPGSTQVDPNLRAEMVRAITAQDDSEELALSPAARGLVEKAMLELEDSEISGSDAPESRTSGARELAESMGDSSRGAQALETVPASVLRKLPVDKEGHVDVFLFLSLEDERSMTMAREMQQVAQRIGANSKHSFSAMFAAPVAREVEASFRIASGATYALRDGARLIRLFRVSTVPSLVFVARSSGAYHVEAGPRSASYVMQVIGFMEGGNE